MHEESATEDTAFTQKTTKKGFFPMTHTMITVEKNMDSLFDL